MAAVAALAPHVLANRALWTDVFVAVRATLSPISMVRHAPAVVNVVHVCLAIDIGDNVLVLGLVCNQKKQLNMYITAPGRLSDECRE